MTNSASQMQRLKKVVKLTTFFLTCGLIYAGIITLLGFGIPCAIHFITGIRCPGCGLTHAMLALLKLDFDTAFRANYALPFILFYIATVFFYTAAKFIKSGKFFLTSGCPLIDWVFLAAIFIWTIVRNIIGV